MELLPAPEVRGETAASDEPFTVLFIDHETRLSGGQQDLVDLVGALAPSRVRVHAALPGDGPLAEALRARGASVHLLGMGAGLRGVSRWELMRRPHRALGTVAGLVLASARAWALIGRVRPAVVHTNSMKAHLVAAMPALLRRRPLVMHVRDILPPGWLRTLVATVGAVFAQRVVCLSEATASQFASTRAARKTEVVHNGIAVARFTGDAPPAMRARLGAAADDQILIGIVGQIAYWKGQDVFVEAAARVAAVHPGARFVVIGECMFPANEAGFDARVRARAAEALGERLRFAGWIDDIPGAVCALDVLVHASREPEPFGRVIVEGMAAGKPVVTTAIGAGPELVPPDAGRLVPPDDAAALAEALIELLDPATRRRCGTAARRAAAGFDITRTARAIEALYERIGRAA